MKTKERYTCTFPDVRGVLYFAVIFLSCFSFSVQGQISVGSSKYEGVKKMNEQYLQQFIKSYQNINTSKSDILKDVQRLKNITGIGHAKYRLDTIEGQVQVVFEVDEVKTLLPIVNFGLVTENLWYRLGVSDYNFRGRGEYISAFYQNNNGFNTGQFYYRNPYVKESRWGYSLLLSSWSSDEPLFFPEGTVSYDYINNSIGTSLIRNFNIYQNVELGATYFTEKYEKSKVQTLEQPPGPDALEERKLLSKFQYQLNKVNYDFFLLEGTFLQLNYQNVFNFDDKSIFNSIAFTGRQFFKFGRFGNLALRLRAAFSTNNFSPFAPFVADSYVNIRGIGNRIDRGTGQLIFNTEYRQTILEKYPFGIQMVIFSDLGGWRNPGGKLSELIDSEKLRHFVGGGLRIIYQQVFGATFRIDYGIDINNFENRGLVIGLGQYF